MPIYLSFFISDPLVTAFLQEKNECFRLNLDVFHARNTRLFAALFTELPNPVGIWVSFRGFFYLVSGKVLPVSSLLSGVFVHRVFCGYFVGFEGAGVMRRFPWCTQENIIKPAMASKSL